MSKPAKDAVDAEILDVIVGGRPVKFDEDDKDAPKEPVKQMFLDIPRRSSTTSRRRTPLSAEIEVVPAGPARDMGLDRSMILGYGHDDRLCLPSMPRPDQRHQRGAHEHHAHRRQRRRSAP